MRKLTTIIVISIVLVNSLFVATVGFVTYRAFFDFASDELSETRVALLNERTNKVSAFINNISEAGVLIATNQDMIELMTDTPEDQFEAVSEQRELRDQINRFMDLKEDIHSIDIYTDRYREYPVIQSDLFYTLTELKTEDWFDVFEQMDHGWLPQHTVAEEDQISYIHRLMDARGQTTGYLKVNVLAHVLFDSIYESGLNTLDHEPLMLINTGGRVIALSQMLDATALHEVIQPIAGEPYYELKDSIDETSNEANDQFLLLTSNPKHNHWRLVQFVPLDQLHAKIKDVGFTVLLVGASGILLSIPLAYWIGQRINVPIRRLISGMNRVEKGDYNEKIGPFFIEEYDVLATNFNDMTTRLTSSTEQIEKEYKQRREAELRALQSQIMPHFLYNTLDLIHWKAMDLQAPDISLMVHHLSKMLRIGVSGGKTFIPLRQELEHVHCYITIQRVRLATDITYVEHIPASLKDLYIPKIILQPFIENSMKHGYQDADGQPTHIKVSASIHEELQQMHIHLVDKGKGLPEDWTLSQSKGIGIRNVEERIRMYCGSTYTIQVENHSDGGTLVTIILPILKSEADVKRLEMF